MSDMFTETVDLLLWGGAFGLFVIATLGLAVFVRAARTVFLRSSGTTTARAPEPPTPDELALAAWEGEGGRLRIGHRMIDRSATSSESRA